MPQIRLTSKSISELKFPILQTTNQNCKFLMIGTWIYFALLEKNLPIYARRDKSSLCNTLL